VAGIMMIVLAPVLAVTAAAVLCSYGRPVLYRQRRVGHDGHIFSMIKFRTLRPAEGGGEADAQWAAAQLGGQAIARYEPIEARANRVGSALRRLSLDELPQLWNVVRGDMSLVGPRPERASYVEPFAQHIYRYGERHRVKSGITGWAQINGLRGETSLAERVEWDNHYIENWSPWLDLKILLLTVPRMLRDSPGR
jgi:lipopolysaccharide/colanic/teichoic acid biosynthesis glycosyltransferase